MRRGSMRRRQMWRDSTWRGSMPYPRPWDLFRKSLPVAGGFRKATYVRIPRIAGYAGRDNVGLGHWKTWVTGRLGSLEDLGHWKTWITGRLGSLEDTGHWKTRVTGRRCVMPPAGLPTKTEN